MKIEEVLAEIMRLTFVLNFVSKEKFVISFFGDVNWFQVRRYPDKESFEPTTDHVIMLSDDHSGVSTIRLKEVMAQLKYDLKQIERSAATDFGHGGIDQHDYDCAVRLASQGSERMLAELLEPYIQALAENIYRMREKGVKV